LANHRDL